MKYARQKAVAAVLDERLHRAYGRGRRALSQNICRSIVNAFVLHGLQFEEAVQLATRQIQTSDPGFVPNLRPSPASTTGAA